MLLRRERDQRGHVPGTTDVLLPTYPLYVDTRGPPAPSRAFGAPVRASAMLSRRRGAGRVPAGDGRTHRYAQVGAGGRGVSRSSGLLLEWRDPRGTLPPSSRRTPPRRSAPRRRCSRRMNWLSSKKRAL